MCKKVTDDGKTRLTCNLFRRGASNGITMQTEEQELIRRIAGGETRLCARLVDRYGRAVYTLAARIAGCTEDAEELTQDIFLKAFSSLDRFGGRSSFSTWLYRIALNECLTFLSKQRAASTVSLDAPEADTLQKLESDPYFSGDKAQMALQKALLTLPEKQRMVFNLKYYQEMKYEQMSDIFGTSVGALKASYHHAVKKIEKILGEED